MANVPLIHPIYLDVPMLVSFAAAIRGGVAMETEVTEETGDTKGTTAKVAGRIGFSKLFQSLFDASIDTSLESDRESEVRASKRESKAHTEASIAILLYHELIETGGYVLRPESISDIGAYGPGSLVEVGGTVEKNAIDQVVDYIDAISILSGMDTSQPAPQPKGGKKQNRSQNRNPQINAVTNELMAIRNALDSDRKRTPISNVVVRCDSPGKLNVVVTLRTANLRDLTLSELDKNNVRVIGKITRVLPEGQMMSSFENYGMALLSPELLNEVFSGLKSAEELAAEFSDIQVAGPAWQILPLMIFV